MGLQIKTYCAPTKSSNSFKKVDVYKTFSLSGVGYLFSTNGEKVDIDEISGYSIGIKLYRKNFILFLTKIPHKKISNIIGYFLYFRSFYVDLIKSLKFCKTIYTVYHKGRHSVSRTSFFNIDCGYVFKREHINAAFSQVEGKIEGDHVCSVCTDVVSNGNDIIVGHKDVKDKNKMVHFHHRTCLERWINDKGSCPICKQIFTKEIADGKDDGGKLYAWIDIFRLSLQFVKYTYEYALSNFREFHFSLIGSICPLIFSSGIPTIFCRHFSLKKYEGKKNEENEFTFSWEQFFSMFSFPDFLNLSLCTKISIGVIFFIQKIGALFELTYIKDHYKRTYTFLKKENAAVNEEKGYKFEFEITILINKDI